MPRAHGHDTRYVQMQKNNCFACAAGVACIFLSASLSCGSCALKRRVTNNRNEMTTMTQKDLKQAPINCTDRLRKASSFTQRKPFRDLVVRYFRTDMYTAIGLELEERREGFTRQYQRWVLPTTTKRVRTPAWDRVGISSSVPSG